MGIIRTSHNRENPYVMLNKATLEDNEISWQAKGLWAYLISKPDSWHVSVSHLSSIYGERGGGEKSIYAMLNELIDKGYCERVQCKGEKGLFTTTEYLIHEFKKCSPHSLERRAVDPSAENLPTTNNRDIQKNEKQQQPVAVSSSIHSCLQTIDIPQSDKEWLTEKYTEERIKPVLVWATHPTTPIKISLAAAIKWGCSKSEPPEVKKSEIDLVQENKKLAEQLIKKYTFPSCVRAEALNKLVEISTDGVGESFTLEYKEAGFKEQLINAIRKKGGQEKASQV